MQMYANVCDRLQLYALMEAYLNLKVTAFSKETARGHTSDTTRITPQREHTRKREKFCMKSQDNTNGSDMRERLSLSSTQRATDTELSSESD